MKSTNRFRLIGLLLVVILLLAACTTGGSSPTQVEEQATPETVATEEPMAEEAATEEPMAEEAATQEPMAEEPTAEVSAQRGGTLRVGTIVDPNLTLYHRRGAHQGPWLMAIYETLTRYDENSEPQPWLAESWDFNGDQTELTLHLRQGIMFHSGRELTAEDVKWNIEHLRIPEVSSQMKAAAEEIVNMETPDAYTIVLTFGSPTYTIFDMFEGMVVLDPDLMEATDAGEGWSGTGPFMVEEWKPGTGLTMTRFEDYWIDGLPLLDRIEITVVPDVDALVLNMEAGALDLILDASASEVVRLQDAPNYIVRLSKNDPVRYFVAFNATEPPFDNKLLRQAFNWAIPRQRYADTVTLGLTEPTDLPFAPVSEAYDEELAHRVTYDPDRARELLDEAGVDPSSMSVTLSYFGGASELEPFSVLYQDALSQLGFDVSVERIDPAAYRDRHFARDWQVLIGLHGNTNMAPVSLLTQNRPYVDCENGTSGLCSEEYAQLQKTLLKETDRDARQALYQQFYDWFFDEVPLAPFGGSPNVMIMTSDVHGLKTNRFEYILFEDISLDN